MKKAFMVASCAGGSMIFNRFDFGPSADLIESPGGWRDPAQLDLIRRVLDDRHQARGAGVVVLDGGANIGTFAVPLARYMGDWGFVIAFEPQRWPFYALCGNLAINNCLNAQARQEALSDRSGAIAVPYLDPAQEHNFGGLELGEPSGEVQSKSDVVHYVPAIAIDAMNLPRLDFLKLDLEGMEPQALRGARQAIRKHLPAMLIEGHKCGAQAIVDELPGGYTALGIAQDMLCIHENEKNPELAEAIKKFGTMRAAA